MLRIFLGITDWSEKLGTLLLSKKIKDWGDSFMGKRFDSQA